MLEFLRRMFGNKAKLMPLLDLQPILPPEKLWFSGKNTSAQSILPELTSLATISSELNLKWSDSILCQASEQQHILNILKTHIKNLNQISLQDCLCRLTELQEKTIIRWIDEDIGWVITLRPGQTLKKGFLCIYAGIIKSILGHGESSYDSREYYNTIIKTNTEEIAIDAKNFGNQSRLFPFLLDNKYLNNFEIHQSIQDKVAVANLEFHLYVLNGVKIPCIEVPEDITAPIQHELLLGINYSLPYLCKMQQVGKPFKLINQETLQQIDPLLYSPKIIEVKLEGLDYSFQVPRFRILVAEQLPQLQQRTLGYDEEKKEYYEIIIADKDLYDALMESPEARSLIVKPLIKRLS